MRMLVSTGSSRMANNEHTFDLQEAAHFLRISPEVLRAKAKSGIINGAKPGKRWVFLESDLVDYLRSIYPVRTGQAPSSGCDNKEVTLCHSTNAVKSGGFGSLLQAGDEYESLLELKKRKQPRNFMIG